MNVFLKRAVWKLYVTKKYLLLQVDILRLKEMKELYVTKKYLLMQVVATGTYHCPKLYVTKKYLLLQVRRFDIAFFSLYVIKKYLLMQVENGVEQKALKLYVIKKYLLMQALYVVIPLALNYMLPTNTCCSRLTRCLIQKKEHFMLSKI